jgi:hypothetical protein
MKKKKIFLVSAPYEDERTGDYDYAFKLVEAIRNIGEEAEYITAKETKLYDSQKMYDALKPLYVTRNNPEDYKKAYKELANNTNSNIDIVDRIHAINRIKEYIKTQKDEQNLDPIVDLQLRPTLTGFVFMPGDIKGFRDAGIRVNITCHEYKLNNIRRHHQEVLHHYFKEANSVCFFNLKDLSNASIHASYTVFNDELKAKGLKAFDHEAYNLFEKALLTRVPPTVKYERVTYDNWEERPPNLISFGIIRLAKGFEEALDIAENINKIDWGKGKIPKMIIAGKPDSMKLLAEIIIATFNDQFIQRVIQEKLNINDYIRKYNHLKDDNDLCISKTLDNIIKDQQKKLTDVQNEECQQFVCDQVNLFFATNTLSVDAAKYLKEKLSEHTTKKMLKSQKILNGKNDWVIPSLKNFYKMWYMEEILRTQKYKILEFLKTKNTDKTEQSFQELVQQEIWKAISNNKEIISNKSQSLKKSIDCISQYINQLNFDVMLEEIFIQKSQFIYKFDVQGIIPEESKKKLEKLGESAIPDVLKNIILTINEKLTLPKHKYLMLKQILENNEKNTEELKNIIRDLYHKEDTFQKENKLNTILKNPIDIRLDRDLDELKGDFKEAKYSVRIDNKGWANNGSGHIAAFSNCCIIYTGHGMCTPREVLPKDNKYKEDGKYNEAIPFLTGKYGLAAGEHLTVAEEKGKYKQKHYYSTDIKMREEDSKLNKDTVQSYYLKGEVLPNKLNPITATKILTDIKMRELDPKLNKNTFEQANRLFDEHFTEDKISANFIKNVADPENKASFSDHQGATEKISKFKDALAYNTVNNPDLLGEGGIYNISDHS